MPRYAIFYAPPEGHPLNEAAARWLGRDAFTGEAVERPSPIEGLEGEAFDALLASATRYGFHGTLKAPFALAEGGQLHELEAALERYCRSLVPFTLPRFVVGQLGPFFALLPSEPSDKLKALASGLVRDFDEFRAPLSEADIARRNPDKLSPVLRDNLINWGYPYIFDNFRFHMTLTDPISEELSGPVRSALEHHFAGLLDEPQEVSQLSLFVEPERGAPFTVLRQYSFG